jgi:hypothetical protein
MLVDHGIADGLLSRQDSRMSHDKQPPIYACAVHDQGRQRLFDIEICDDRIVSHGGHVRHELCCGPNVRQCNVAEFKFC